MPAVCIELPQNPTKDTQMLSQELLDIIPNASTAHDAPEITVQIIEDIRPQWIVLKSTHIQIVLKIIAYKSRHYLGLVNPISKDHPPQLVVNNFSTDAGMKIADFLTSIFPFSQQSRQVANFTVQGDFLFFRLYQYCFGEKGPIMENVGPHLTLRLWRMTEYSGDKKKVTSFKKFVKNAGVL